MPEDHINSGSRDETIDDRSPRPAAGEGFLSASSQTEKPRVVVEGYEVESEISRGGQAVVFLATKISTGRKVALKVLRKGRFLSDRDRTRFDREVQILASLKHPNIVSIIDRGTTKRGAPYFAMQYIEGTPLDQVFKSWHREQRAAAEPEDPAQLLRVFLTICEAVNEAHLRGIVHRDLKPSNIRLDEDGNPHVLDFGLARTGVQSFTGGDDGQPVTVTGQFLGSMPWASPEQAEGRPDKIDIRTDVYALGVILYQMLTGGRFPYDVRGNMRDVLDNIMTATPTAPSQVIDARLARAQRRSRSRFRKTGSVNPIIEAIVLKALAKAREDRYQSAGELARDIRAYLEGGPTIAEPVASAPSRRGAFIAGGAVAAILAIGVAVGTWAALRPDDPTPAPPVAVDPDPIQPIPAVDTDWKRHSLLDYIDPIRLTRSSKWNIEEGAARVQADDPARLPMLILADDEYELTVAFTRQSGTGPIEIRLPVAGRTTSLMLSTGSGRKYSGLSRIDGQDAHADSNESRRAGVLFNRRRYELRIRVRIAEDQALIESTLNDRRYVNWEGDVASLSPPPGWASGDKGFGIGVARGDVALHEVTMRCDADRSQITPRRLSRITMVSNPGLIDAAGWTIETRKHRGVVRSVAVDPTGKILASGAEDGTVRLWSLPDRELKRVIPAHDWPVWDLGWSHDGKYLASSATQSVKVWSVDTGRMVWSRSMSESPHERRSAWSPRELLLAYVSRSNYDGRIEVVRIPSGESVASIENGGSRNGDPAWSPDGKLLAIADSKRELQVWDVESGERLRHVEGTANDYFPYTGWLPASRTVVWGWSSMPMRKLDLSGGDTEEPSPLFEHPEPPFAIAVSPDGTRMATLHRSHRINIWDIPTGKILKHIESRPGRASLCWTVDGKTLIAGAAHGTIDFIDVDTGTRDDPIAGIASNPRTVGWSRDGARLLYRSNGRHFAVDAAAEWQPRAVLPDRSAIVGRHPDGDRIAYRHPDEPDKVSVWSIAQEKSIWTSPGTFKGKTHAIWSPDGRLLAIGATSEPRIAIWNVATNQLVHQIESEHNSRRLHWVAGGSAIGIVDNEKKARLYRLSSNKPFAEIGPLLRADVMAWSPDGSMLAERSEPDSNCVALWDTGTGEVEQLSREHGSGIERVLWSPDGRRLATSSGSGIWNDGSVCLWDVETRKLIRRWNYGQHCTRVLQWSDDGRVLGAESDSNRSQRWDVRTASLIAHSEGDVPYVGGVRWSPTADLVAHHGNYAGRPIHLRRASTGDRQLSLVQLDRDRAVALSPDGHYRATSEVADDLVYVVRGFDGSLRTLAPDAFADEFGWTNDPSRVGRIAPPPEPAPAPPPRSLVADGPPGQVMAFEVSDARCAAFMPDGRQVLASDGSGGMVLWDMAQQRIVRVFEPSGNRVDRIAVASDGAFAVTAHSDGAPRVWDIRTGRMTKKLAGGHSGPVRDVIVLPGDWRVASAGEDSNVVVWDLVTSRVLARLEGHKDKVLDLKLMPDGKQLVSAGHDQSIRFWNLETLEQVKVLSGQGSELLQVGITGGGRYTVGLSGGSLGISLWDLENDKKLGSNGQFWDRPTHLETTSDGSRFIWAATRSIEFWDARGADRYAHFSIPKDENNSKLRSIELSPDDRLAVAASGDGLVRLWRLPKPSDPPWTPRGQTQRFDAHEGAVHDAIFTKDGRHVLSAGADNTVRLWDAVTGQQKHVFTGHTRPVRTLALSPDGRTFLSGSADHSVRWWDIESRTLLHEFAAMKSSPNAADFYPDGKRAICGDGSGQFYLLDLTQRRAEVVTTNGRPIHSISVSSDGGHVLYVSDGRLMELDPATNKHTELLHVQHSRIHSVSHIAGTNRAVLSGAGPVGCVSLWDVSERKVAIKAGQNWTSNPDAAATADGRLIVFCTNSHWVLATDATTMKQAAAFDGHSRSVNAVDVSPDGRYAVSASDDGTVRVWQLPAPESR